MKKKHRSSLLDVIQYTVVGVIAFSNLFLIGENIYRVLLLELLLLLWFVFSVSFKSSIKASLLLFIIVLPLNITLVLTHFGDPYIRGVFANYLSPTLSILDLFTFILLVSIIFSSLRKSTLTDLLKEIPIWLSLIVVGLLIHLVLHPSILSLLNVGRVSLYLTTVVLLLKSFQYLLTPSFVKLIAITISFSLLLQVVIAFFQTFNSADLGLQFLGESEILSGTIGSSFINLESGIILRGYGTFPHPNLLAGYMLLTFLTAIYFIPKGLLRAFIVLLSILGILLAFSRVAWLLLLIFIVICMAERVIRRGGKYILSILPISYFERITSLFALGDSSGRDRVELLKHSFGVIKANWEFGVGSGNYVSTMKEMAVYTGSGLLLLQPVHNIFILLFSEYGTLGVFFSLGILYKVFLYNIRRGNFSLYLSILLFVVLVGLTDHYLVTLPQGLAMLLILLIL